MSKRFVYVLKSEEIAPKYYFSTFTAALVIATSTRILTYLVTCLALPVLRRRRDVTAPLFELRAGVPIAAPAP
jgi:amino acid transporter